MTNNDLLPLASLVRMINARANGEIGGPAVDAKIDQLVNGLDGEDKDIALRAIWAHDA